MKQTITPGDWVVEANLDLYGHYVLYVAAVEQETWVNQGFDVSDKEGERRQRVANRHDAANAALMSAAPKLFEIVRVLAERENDDPLVADAVELLETMGV